MRPSRQRVQAGNKLTVVSYEQTPGSSQTLKRFQLTQWEIQPTLTCHSLCRQNAHWFDYNVGFLQKKKKVLIYAFRTSSVNYVNRLNFGQDKESSQGFPLRSGFFLETCPACICSQTTSFGRKSSLLGLSFQSAGGPAVFRVAERKWPVVKQRKYQGILIEQIVSLLPTGKSFKGPGPRRRQRAAGPSVS